MQIFARVQCGLFLGFQRVQTARLVPPPQVSRMFVAQEGDFQASARKDVVVGYDTVFQNLTTRHYQLVDTRPENEFTGAEGGGI